MNKFKPAASSGLKLRANFSWTFVGNVINAGCWFSMAIVLVKLGSPEHLGQFALGLATTAPIFMFASLRLRDVQATDAKEEYLFVDFLALRLITTALSLLVVVGIVSLSGFQRATALVILATGCSKAIENISDAFYGLFMRHERLDRVAKSLMMKGPLSLLGLGIGFYLTGSVFWGVIGLATARTTIMLTYDLRNAILTLNPTSKRISNIIPKEWPRPRWNAKILTRLAWLALPLGFVTMLISFTSNIPRYFIEGYMGSYHLGIFAAIASFQKVAPTVVQALGRSASPRLAKYYSVNDTGAFRQLMFKMIAIGAVLGGAGVLVALVLGPQILTLFYGPAYVLHELFVLLMLAAGIDYIATMLLFAITSARYFKIQLPLQLITTGAVAFACYKLIPSAGLTGAAMALIIGNLCRAGCGVVVAWHVQRSLSRPTITSCAQISTSRLSR